MTRKKEKTMVKLPLEGTPQGGLSCPYGAIHLQLAPKATDEVAAEGGKSRTDRIGSEHGTEHAPRPPLRGPLKVVPQVEG